eukprot:CAMPEP_0194350082 /NCGR_PEP_ID=MMETSP0171-20130528/107443_1 /TAXON_ID=218684 /ORGANISM="Corethron pennatum, Strain L29A3" /LENGTH=419 /DNA_ID=CAMNT_0039117597 /DNA_START=63 /DNA_END=1319 /DNA_ORIENTATION=+
MAGPLSAGAAMKPSAAPPGRRATTAAAPAGTPDPSLLATAVPLSAGALPLSSLQGLCKRDPASHRPDFLAQYNRLRGLVDIITASQSSGDAGGVSKGIVERDKDGEGTSALIHFIAAAAAGCYPDLRAEVAEYLLQLVDPTMGMPRHVTGPALSGLILMRDRSAVRGIVTLPRFMLLLGAPDLDKQAAHQLYVHIVNDIRHAAAGKRGIRQKKNVPGGGGSAEDLARLNAAYRTAFQQVVRGHAEAASVARARRVLDATAALYRLNVWTEGAAGAVGIMAAALASPDSSVYGKAMRFFLNIEEQKDQEEKAKMENTYKVEINYHKFSKKTRKRNHSIDKQKHTRTKKQKERDCKDFYELPAHSNDRGAAVSRRLYPAMELITDPQGVAERCLKLLRAAGAGGSAGIKFETKLLVMNFTT